MWVLLLALVVAAAPGVRLLGPANAYAFDDPAGGFYDQDGSNGGGGAGTGTSYGDPDGPKAGSSSRNNPWRTSWGGGAGFRGAGVYGQAQVGFVGRVWTMRDLIVALRIYYLRY